MKLSPQVGIGLKRLGNQNLISEDCFKKIIEAAPEIIARSRRINLSQLCTSKGDIVKECFAALLILLVESACHDLDDKSFRSTMEIYNFTSDRLSLVSKLYSGKRDELRNLVLRVQHSLPHIIDISWRLDFCIKSSSCVDSYPVFFIQLVGEARTNKMTGGIIVRKYNFMCTLQELEELVNKLRDGLRHIESIANIK